MKYFSKILLTYAHSDDSPLKALHTEERKVEDLLKDELLKKKGCKKIIERFLGEDINRLIPKIEKYRNSLLFFSYSGHADETSLLLKHQQAFISGFSKYFEPCKNLRCVLLNGCNTRSLVNFFHQVGVSIVIAAPPVLEDEKAANFAVSFFEELMAGQSIREAYEEASRLIETIHGHRGAIRSVDHRGLDLTSEKKETYGIYCKEGDERFLEFNLERLVQDAHLREIFKDDPEQSPKHQNTLVITCKYKKLPGYKKFHKKFLLGINDEKLPHNIGFLDPSGYLNNSFFSYDIFNDLIKNIGKVIFLSHKRMDGFYNSEDLIQSVFEIIKKRQIPRWIVFLEACDHDASKQLRIDQNEKRDKHFPVNKNKFYYYDRRSEKNSPDLIHDLVKALKDEQEHIVKHISEFDLKKQKESINSYFRKENLPNATLVLIDGSEESGWQVLLKDIRKQVENDYNSGKSIPFKEVSYRTINTWKDNADHIYRIMFDSLLRGEAGRARDEYYTNPREAFLDELCKRLNSEALIWVITDIDAETLPNEATPQDVIWLKDWWADIRKKLQFISYSYRLFIIYISDKGSFKLSVDEFIGKPLYIPQTPVKESDIQDWRRSFRSDFFDLKLPQGSRLSYGKGVKLIGKALGKDIEARVSEIFHY